MKVIGVAGFARAGKDTFVSIAIDILKKNGIMGKQYSFAAALKKELEPFVRDVCKSDVWTTDTETKTDMRDLLVWYGTTWWRKRDPKRWIRGVDLAIKAEKENVAVALVSDVRYPNEGEWVHSWQGYLVHVAAYDPKLLPVKAFKTAPNEQERINDPIVKDQADYRLEWPAKGLTPEGAFNDLELRTAVLKALNACDYFNETLSL
jgi:hypothetical protein